MPLLWLEEGRTAALELLIQISRRLRTGCGRQYSQWLRILLKNILFFLWIARSQRQTAWQSF